MPPLSGTLPQTPPPPRLPAMQHTECPPATGTHPWGSASCCGGHKAGALALHSGELLGVLGLGHPDGRQQALQSGGGPAVGGVGRRWGAGRVLGRAMDKGKGSFSTGSCDQQSTRLTSSQSRSCVWGAVRGAAGRGARRVCVRRREAEAAEAAAGSAALSATCSRPGSSGDKAAGKQQQKAGRQRAGESSRRQLAAPLGAVPLLPGFDALQGRLHPLRGLGVCRRADGCAGGKGRPGTAVRQAARSTDRHAGRSATYTLPLWLSCMPAGPAAAERWTGGKM